MIHACLPHFLCYKDSNLQIMFHKSIELVYNDLTDTSSNIYGCKVVNPINKIVIKKFVDEMINYFQHAIYVNIHYEMVALLI